jgi:hypothetical protein
VPGEDVGEAAQVLAEPPAQFGALDPSLQSAFVEFIYNREAMQPHMTANWLGLQLVQNGVLPMGTAQVRGLVMQAIKEGILLEGIHETVHRETGQPFFLRTVRLNTDHPIAAAILQLGSSFPPPAAPADDGGARQSGEPPSGEELDLPEREEDPAFAP